MRSMVYCWEVVFLFITSWLQVAKVRPPREHGASLVPRLAAQERSDA